MAAKRYRVLVGINYPPKGKGDTEKRAEPGDVVDDLPPGVVKVWLEQGVIEEEVAGDAA
ncbi:MAG TPA: hypothetical protein VFC00_30720 [Micromonosporaceae bacterium]|nr:hypothetical protein [Micromonosporaceae bacterium]